jgi:hypothetical protein
MVNFIDHSIGKEPLKNMLKFIDHSIGKEPFKNISNFKDHSIGKEPFKKMSQMPNPYILAPISLLFLPLASIARMATILYHPSYSFSLCVTGSVESRLGYLSGE